MIGINGNAFFKKSQTAVFTIAAVMISLGQWADTKEILISAYESFVTHFTDKVELQKLSEVKVGANLTYLETIFGDAKLIKVKPQNTGLQYRYYHEPKFLLTLAVVQQRIVGYQIISLQEHFTPHIAFSDQHLGVQPISAHQSFHGSFNTDTSNLRYYLESLTLGREGLFLERQLGFVEYGAATEQYQTELQQLNDLLLQDYDDEKMIQISSAVRSKLVPNVYSVGEITLEQSADMLLTRYEYKAYFHQGE